VTRTEYYPSRFRSTFDLVEANVYRPAEQPSTLHWNDIVVFTVDNPEPEYLNALLHMRVKSH